MKFGMRSKSAKQVLQAILANFHTDTDRPRESILGSPDIQSLADLRNSYAGITEMRTLLPNRRTVTIVRGLRAVGEIAVMTCINQDRQRTNRIPA